MTTSNFDDRLSGFYDGELSPEETAELQAFLSQSPSAKQTLEDFANLSGLLRELHESEQNSIHEDLRAGSTDFYDQLMQRVTGLPADLVNPPSLASSASNGSVVPASKSPHRGWRRTLFAFCAVAVSAIAVGPFALFWLDQNEVRVAEGVPNGTEFGRDRALKMLAGVNAPAAGNELRHRSDNVLAMRTSNSRDTASRDTYELRQDARTLSAATGNEELSHGESSSRPALDQRLADSGVENETAAALEFAKFGSLNTPPLAGSAGEFTVDLIADQQTEVQFNKLVTAQAYFSLNNRNGNLDAAGNSSNSLNKYDSQNSSDAAGMEQRTIPTLCCEVLDEHHGLQVVQLTLSEVGAGNTSEEFFGSAAARAVVAMADSEQTGASEVRQQLTRDGSGTDDTTTEVGDGRAEASTFTAPAFKPGSDAAPPAAPTVATAEQTENLPANGLADAMGRNVTLRSGSDSDTNSTVEIPSESGNADVRSTDDSSGNRSNEYGILVTTDAATLKRFLRSLNRRKDVVLNTDVGNVTLSELPEETQSLVLANTVQQNSTFFNLTNGGNLDQLAEQVADAPINTNTLMMASAAPVVGIPVSNSAMDFGPPGAGGFPGAGGSAETGRSLSANGLLGGRPDGERRLDVAASKAEQMGDNSALKSERDAERGGSAAESKRTAGSSKNGISDLPALGKTQVSELPPKTGAEAPASGDAELSDNAQAVAMGDSTLPSKAVGKKWGDDAGNGDKASQAEDESQAMPADNAADKTDGQSVDVAADTPRMSPPGKVNQPKNAGDESATESESSTGAQGSSKPANSAGLRGNEALPIPEGMGLEEKFGEKVAEATRSMGGRESNDSAKRLKEKDESESRGMKRDESGEKADPSNQRRRSWNGPTNTNGREVVRSNVERPGLAGDPSKKQTTRGYERQDSANRYMSNRAGNTSQNYYVNIPPTLGEQVIAQNRGVGLGVNKDGVLNKDGSVYYDAADTKSQTKLATEVHATLAQPATVGAMYNWAAQIPAQQLINLPQDEQMPVQLLIVFERPTQDGKAAKAESAGTSAGTSSSETQPDDAASETQPPEVPPPQQ